MNHHPLFYYICWDMKCKYQLHYQCKHETPFNYYRSIFRYVRWLGNSSAVFIREMQLPIAQWQLHRKQFTRRSAMINGEINKRLTIESIIETRSQLSFFDLRCVSFDIISALNDADISQYQFALKFSLGHYVNGGRFLIIHQRLIRLISPSKNSLSRPWHRPSYCFSLSISWRPSTHTIF